MTRVVIHTAVPDARRAIAATMTGLSGLPDEHSVELISIPGGPSARWDSENGYGGTWWGASQALVEDVAQAMFSSGYALATESWFTAVWEESGTLVRHNLPTAPADPSFGAFLAVCGLERVAVEPFQ